MIQGAIADGTGPGAKMSQQSGHSATAWRLPPWPMLALGGALALGLMAAIVAERDQLLGRYEAGALIESLPDDGGSTFMDISATWSFRESDLAVLAEVPIAERRETIRISIRPNTDQDLDASHIIEIVTPDTYPGRKTAAIDGVYVKEQRSDPGRPLIGAAISVGDGLHWFVMSGVPQDRRANLNLLSQAGIFQINLHYESGAQAMIAIEKGDTGKAAFEQAFAAWSRQG